MLRQLIARWFPRAPDRALVEVRLRDFYRVREDYHRMTASADKGDHPQVRLLQCLLKAGERYVEVGCGGGIVARLAATGASVCACDVSLHALKRMAVESAPGLDPIQCEAATLPFRDGCMAGAYSLEVLEHLWDPVAAVREMIRVVRPGGFILLSFPNAFSLDLHLGKRSLARAADCLFAGMRYVADRVTHRPFVHLGPVLGGDVYPDCDMVTAIIPCDFVRAIEAMGCRVEFWDTTYMCAHRQGARTTLDFQRNTDRWFVRHFGDHVLILARKG